MSKKAEEQKKAKEVTVLDAFERAVNEKGRTVSQVHSDGGRVPRIRVSWQGCMTRVRYAESPMVEAPATAVVGKVDLVPRFCQANMTYQQYLVSNLGLGGSKDLLGARPRTLYQAHALDSARGRVGVIFSTALTPAGRALPHNKARTLPIPCNDAARAFLSGSAQETCANDKIARISSLACRTPDARDTMFANNICLRSVQRKGPEELFVKALQMQASQWALFYSLFNYLLNYMGRGVKPLYTANLGFTRTVDHTGRLILGVVDGAPRCKAQRLVYLMLEKMAAMVHAVVSNTVCLLKPWMAVNLSQQDMVHIGKAVEATCDQALHRDMLSALATAGFLSERNVWKNIVGRLLDLNAYFKAAYASCKISRSLLCELETPLFVFNESRFGGERPNGYEAVAQAYCELIANPCQFHPSFGFCPIDGDLFIAYLCKQMGGEGSEFYFASPYICALAFIAQQYALKASGVRSPIQCGAGTSFFMNALGPLHLPIMQNFFKQAKIEHDYIPRYTESFESLDLSTLPRRPSLYAINTMDFVVGPGGVFKEAEFASLYLRVLTEESVSRLVLFCETKNANTWFPKVGFLMTRDAKSPNRLCRRIMADRIICAWRAYASRTVTKLAKDRLRLQAARERRASHSRLKKAQRKQRLRSLREAEQKAKLQDEQQGLEKQGSEQQGPEQQGPEQQVANKAAAADAVALWVQARFRGAKTHKHLRMWMALVQFQKHVRGFLLRRRNARVTAQPAREETPQEALPQEAPLQEALPEVPLTTPPPQEAPQQVPQEASQQEMCLREPHVFTEACTEARLYAEKVHAVARQLEHVFAWENLMKDNFLLSHTAVDGTVAFDVLLWFPRIRMYACTVSNPVLLLVHAATCVRYVVFVWEHGIGNRHWRNEYRTSFATFTAKLMHSGAYPAPIPAVVIRSPTSPVST